MQQDFRFRIQCLLGKAFGSRITLGEECEPQKQRFVCSISYDVVRMNRSVDHNLVQASSLGIKNLEVCYVSETVCTPTKCCSCTSQMKHMTYIKGFDSPALHFLCEFDHFSLLTPMKPTCHFHGGRYRHVHISNARMLECMHPVFYKPRH